MSTIRYFLCIFLGLTISLSACLPAHEITRTNIPLQLGDTTVDLLIHESSAAGLTYLNLHDNENTSVRAALTIIKRHGGRVFELKHSGSRNISFTIDGTDYEFDPNRMFNDHGAAASLERFGPVDDSAIAAVRSFSQAVLNQLDIDQLDILVTLHNNGQGEYSILSYTPKGVYSKDASQVNVNEKLDPDDFYYVTESVNYHDLLKSNQNIILQDNDQVTQDGSLSVWSAQEQLPYINVEAQNRHRRTQMDMLLLLHELYYLKQNR